MSVSHWDPEQIIILSKLRFLESSIWESHRDHVSQFKACRFKDTQAVNDMAYFHNQRVIWSHFLSFLCSSNPTCFITKTFDLPVLKGMQIPTTTSSDWKFNSAHLEVTKIPWKYFYLLIWYIPLFFPGQHWNNFAGLIRF